MAVAGNVSLHVIADAQENIRAVMKQANTMIRQSTNELKRASAAQKNMGSVVDKVKSKVIAFKGALLAMGVAAAAAAAKQLFEFAKTGAMIADQLDAVTDRVANTEELLQRTRVSTSGMIDDAAIAKGIALFDSFGMELDALPDLYEQATKASIRTGEGIDMLLESAIRGIARLSPRIVDNLGIQIELSQATELAAQKFNIEAQAVDETQKKAGMLALVLEQLGTLNKDINLNESRVASIRSLEVSFTNFKNTMSKEWANLFVSVGDKLTRFAHISAVALNRTQRMWSDATSVILRGIKEVGRAEEELAKLKLTTIRGEELERTKVVLRRQAEDEIAVKAIRIRAEFERQIQAQFWTDEDGRQQLREGRAAELKRLGEAKAAALKEMGLAERKRLDKDIDRMETAHGKQSARDRAAITAMTDRGRLSRGETENELERERIIARIAKMQKESNHESLQAYADEQAALKSVNVAIKEERKTVGAIKEIREGGLLVLADRLADMLDENRLLRIKDDLEKAAFRKGMRDKEVIKETAALAKRELEVRLSQKKWITREEKKSIKLDVESLKLRYKRAALDNSHLQFLQDKDDIEGRDGVDEDTGLRDAKVVLAVLNAQTAEEKVRLETQHEIAEINISSISDAEKLLRIAIARKMEARSLADITADNIAMVMGAISGPVGDAAGMLNEMDQNLERLGRPKRYQQIADGFAALSSQQGQIAKSTGRLSKAVASGSEDVGAAMGASLSAVGPVVAAFGKTIAAKAAILATFETAAGFASIMNPVESAAHFTAAAMYATLAGIAASQPTSAKETAGGGDLITPAMRPQEQEAQRIVVNFGPGVLFGMPQEMGRAIADRIASMAGTGMEATAF